MAGIDQSCVFCFLDSFDQYVTYYFALRRRIYDNYDLSRQCIQRISVIFNAAYYGASCNGPIASRR